MTLTNLVPGGPVWDLHLDAVADQPGVYSISLHDPQTWTEAGPLYLMFPSAEYAFTWLSSYAYVEDESTSPATLAAGDTVVARVLADKWGPMLSILYHCAHQPGRLESLWWYGSSPPWVPVDPLLPYDTDTNDHPAAASPATRVFGAGVLEQDGQSPLAVMSADVTIRPEDGDRNARTLTVRALIRGRVSWPLVDEPVVDAANGTVSMRTQSGGSVHLRPLKPGDGTWLSRMDGDLPVWLLTCLVAAIETFEDDNDETYDADRHPAIEHVEALAGRDSHTICALRYLQEADDLEHADAWRDAGEWSQHMPTDSALWLADWQGQLASGRLDPEVDGPVDAFGPWWEQSTAHRLEAHAVPLMMRRFDAGQPIDISLAEIGSLPGHTDVAYTDLSAYTQSVIARTAANVTSQGRLGAALQALVARTRTIRAAKLLPALAQAIDIPTSAPPGAGRYIKDTTPFRAGKPADTSAIRSFTTLPPALQSLVQALFTRVEDRVGEGPTDDEDVDLARSQIAGFITGHHDLTENALSAHMARLLRALS